MSSPGRARGEINGFLSLNYDDIVSLYYHILVMPLFDYLFGYLSYSSKQIPQERKEGYIYQQLPTKVLNLEIDESDKHSFSYAENVDVPFEIVVQRVVSLTLNTLGII